MTEQSYIPRLRVFAGPNGSGKSTVIESVRGMKVNGRLVDFGTYVNADEIARQLRMGSISLSDMDLGEVSLPKLQFAASRSGLLDSYQETIQMFQQMEVNSNEITLNAELDTRSIEKLAQILADAFRQLLFDRRKKLSFETVFSHDSKVEFMQQCKENGYRVYFYFVGTSSPEINLYRVASRVRKGGHDVPEDKIRQRYDRSMGLMWEAAQHCHRAFFFDNSFEGQQALLFCQFSTEGGKKKWDFTDGVPVPAWFSEYYFKKAAQNL